MFKDPTNDIVSPFRAILNDELLSALIGRGSGARVQINTGFALDYRPVMEIERACKSSAFVRSSIGKDLVWKLSPRGRIARKLGL
jgi:hypothetical protein